LIRVARAVQRAAAALAPAASPAAAAPEPEPPPRLPGQPPEHWLALVREHAPGLLAGRDRPVEIERPALPGYADTLAVPPVHHTPTTTPDVEPARLPAAHPVQHNASDSQPARVAGEDRPVSRIHMGKNAEGGVAAARELTRHERESVPRAKPLARLGGAVWEKLTGRARSQTPPAPKAVQSRQTVAGAPALKLTQPAVPDRFPAWSWVGPRDTADRARPAARSTPAEWPSLPAHTSLGAHSPVRPPVGSAAQPLNPAETPPDPWPALPDDGPLWTVPMTGYAADRLARLEQEQAGG
jgi:hypothetical protein